MGLATAIGIGGALLGGVMKSKSASKQNKQTQASLDKISKLGTSTTNQITGMYNPYTTAGGNSLNAMTSFMGGDMSGYENSPFYKATETMFDQESNSMKRLFAAGGALGSGGAARDLGDARYRASIGGYANYLNGHQGLMSQGFQATGNVSNALMNNFETQAGVLSGKAASNNAATGARYDAMGGVLNAGMNAMGKWFG